MILPLILLMLILIGLLAASFAFHVNARLASTQVSINRLQTRLAAESCVEKVKLILSDDRLNMDRWYDNQDELHRTIVWKPGADESVLDTNEEFEDEPMVYRCSVVADDFTDDEELIRLGVTDEASKLNVNEATRDQLMILVSAAVGDREDVDPEELVAAILDWRDDDSDADAGTEEGDTEGEYYNELIKPYKVKNGPFDTIEEILLVKGMDGRILYGEDYDRNGLLSPNEDDGDERFPPDNGDGDLNLGLFPHITVHSRDFNVSNDERDRIYLYGDERKLRSQLMEEFDDRAKLQFVLAAIQPQGGGGSGGSSKRSGGSGGQDTSSEKPGGGGGDSWPGQSGGGSGGQGTSSGKPGGGSTTDDNGRPITARDDPKSSRLAQVRPGGSSRSPKSGWGGESGGDKATTGGEDTAAGADGTTTGGSGDGTTSGGITIGDDGRIMDADGNIIDDGTNRPGDEAAEEEGGGGNGDNGRFRTPAELLLDHPTAGRSPFDVEDLPILMDRLTADPPRSEIPGLINVNTAPHQVLRCIPGLTEDEIDAIVSKRENLDPETKATTAWLVTEDVLDFKKFVEIAPLVTARGTQFTIESLGYADFIGMVTRLQVVVEMRGPMVQAMYHRDLTHLGGHYPIREDDLEELRGR